MKLQLQRAIALLNTKKPDADKAMMALKPVLKKKNAPWPAYHYMGVALLQKREYGNAVNFLQEALNRGSDEPETYHLLSVASLELGKFKEAEEHGQEALRQRPEFFKAWLNLGSVYRAQARLDEALKCFQKANQLDPRSAGVAFRIASIYRDQGNLKKALELYDIALKIDNEYYEALGEKARIYQKLRKFDKALECLDAILKKKPRDLDARVTSAEIYRSEGKYEEAISRYEEILSEYPKFGAVRVNYALALQEIGRFNESESNYLKAFEDQPDSVESVSNYLMGLHYNPDRTREEIFDAHKMWDRHFSPAKRPERPEPYDKSPGRRLRIGLLSGGFWRHPVGWMITLALENLPKDRFEIYCYTTNNLSDDLTRRIHTVSDSWKSVLGYRDEVIAGMIRDDEIDILVELSGHSADNRLRTVAMEPAPVIVKWVGGLFNTTGLRAVDYLLTDWHETPEGEEAYYTEKLVRMPDDYICFLPPDYAPETGPLPSVNNDYITFGCFNNPTKVNPVVLEKWAAIMRRVPESRLVLKSKQYDTEIFTRRIIEQMASLGISSDRLEFEGYSPHTELLEKYNEVDIALDPWPYSGGLSTCEALWMGVPVITLPGPTFAGRHSATHLTNAGLPELVVDSWDEHIEKAVALAGDKKALAEMRAGLREQVSRSPLCDAERFGAHLDVAFREMWRQRVAGWESGAEEWRDHIAVEAGKEVAEETAEAVDALDAGAAAETKTSERKKSGQSRTETEFGEERTAAEAIDETEYSVEREAGKTEVKTEYSEERKTMEAFDQAGNRKKQETEKSIVETEETDRAGVEASPSGNGVQQVSGDMPVNGHRAHPREKNGRVRNNEAKTWKIETKDDVTICTPADLNMLTPYVLLEQEQWYEPEIQFVRDYLKPGMNVVDVGAGFGVYALPMAKKVGLEGKVYAFEPGSMCRRHLEMSKVENVAVNLEVISRAVNDKSGKAVLKLAETPEWNQLKEPDDEKKPGDKEEKVSAVTLDAWWEFEGRPEIDFLKVDVNGHEARLLQGASAMLSDLLPVIMVAGNRKSSDFEEILEVLSGPGYRFYEYVPGPELLVPHDSRMKPDAYIKNLVAIKQDKVDSLLEAGRIHDENAETVEPPDGKWESYLSELPWTESVIDNWRKQAKDPKHSEYFRALDYLCQAISDEVSASVKANLMLESANILIGLYNRGRTGTAVSMTLARVMNELGKREQAVEVIRKLLQTSKMGKGLTSEQPFLPPLKECDSLPVKSRFDNWMMVRLIESWMMLKNVAGYPGSEQEYKMLYALDENPDIAVRTEKRIYLNKLTGKAGIDKTGNPGFSKEIELDKNLWFWSWSNEKNTKNGDDKDVINIFPPTFWTEPFDSAKAQKVVNFTRSFEEGGISETQLGKVIDESQDRLQTNPQDNVAFFILVKGLLSRRCDDKTDSHLNKKLIEKNWEYKRALYHYWFDNVEYINKIKNPKISVIVISNKKKKETVENLKKLKLQIKGKGELIFVNNGQADESFKRLKKFIDIYVKLKSNAGAYLARNIGALYSSGPVLLFADDDGLPDKKFVDAHLDAIRSKDAIAVRGACLPITNKERPWHYYLGDEVKPAVILLEGNASYSADSYYKAGGWGDYILFGHGGMELSYRLLKINSDKRKQIYDPRPILRHDYIKNENNNSEKQKKQTNSFRLISALYPNIGMEIKQWPLSFNGSDIASTTKINSSNKLPSKVKEVNIDITGGECKSHKIWIPEKELIRIKNIFYEHEYRLPNNFKLKEGSVVLDVGANVGTFALYASLWNKNLNIYCFEPNPQVHELLRKNTEHLNNVDINCFALGLNDGVLELSQHPLNTGQTSTTIKIKNSNIIEIPVKNTQNVLKEKEIEFIDVLKIDTEGAEVDILYSMKDYISSTKIIMLEYHSEKDRKEIEKLLSGFLLYSADVQGVRGVGTIKYINMNYI